MSGKEDIKERMDRWVDYAKSQGIELARILVHPDDYFDCPCASSWALAQ